MKVTRKISGTLSLKDKGIRPEGASQGQRIEGEIILPRGRVILNGMKRYAELIGNYKKQGIKSLCDNIIDRTNTVKHYFLRKSNAVYKLGKIGES